MAERVELGEMNRADHRGLNGDGEDGEGEMAVQTDLSFYQLVNIRDDHWTLHVQQSKGWRCLPDSSVASSDQDVIGTHPLHSPDHAPVADPGLTKNLCSNSNASNLA